MYVDLEAPLSPMARLLLFAEKVTSSQGCRGKQPRSIRDWPADMLAVLSGELYG